LASIGYRNLSHARAFEIPPNWKSVHLRKDAEPLYLQAFSGVWQKAMMRKSPLSADLKRYFLK